jgi:hypothetical protein
LHQQRSSDNLDTLFSPIRKLYVVLFLLAVAQALAPERMTAFDYVMSNGGAAYEGATTSQQQPVAATTSIVSSEVSHSFSWLLCSGAVLPGCKNKLLCFQQQQWCRQPQPLISHGISQ